MSAKTKYTPQVWTLVRAGKPIKTCLVCARRIRFIGKLKTVDGSDQYEEIIHPVAINLEYFHDGKLEICQFQSKDGRWEISTELEKFHLTEKTASAALAMAWRFLNPKSKIDDQEMQSILHHDIEHSKAVAAKRNASTIWKLKAFLCHVIWERERLTIKQRLQSLAMQGHPNITAKAYDQAIYQTDI
jgi:hypothetical protein